MKIKTSILKEKLNNLIGIIPSNPIVPILDCFLVSIQDNFITFLAFDLKVSIKSTIEIEKGVNSIIAVSAKTITDTVNSINDEYIELDINKDKLIIKSSTGQYKISIENSNEYPKPKEVNSNSQIIIYDELEYLLKQVISTISSDEMKPSMCGVYFDGDNNSIVTSDGTRISKVNFINDSSFIIDKKTANLVLKVFESDITINSSKDYISFSNEDYTITSRLIDEVFPQYQNVIPTYDDYFEVSRMLLIHSTKRVQIFSNQKTSQCKFIVSNNKITIEANDVDKSCEAKEDLKCESTKEITFGVNSKLLLEMINNIPDDTLKIYYESDNKPLVIKQKNNLDYTGLLMPVLINS